MYKKIKIFIYLIGFVFTSYFYIKEGLTATHTPPTTFVLSFFMLILSVVWIHIDYILSHLLSIYKTTYKEHSITILIFFIIIIIIFSQ